MKEANVQRSTFDIEKHFGGIPLPKGLHDFSKLLAIENGKDLLLMIDQQRGTLREALRIRNPARMLLDMKKVTDQLRPDAAEARRELNAIMRVLLSDGEDVRQL